MASHSFAIWQTRRCQELDQIRSAHRQIGGHAPGRRWTTQQINHSYVVLLTSHFQGFCRDLHSECVDCIVTDVVTKSGPSVGRIVQRALGENRWLDRGNPTPENVRKDFENLGIELWAEASALDSRTSIRKNRLEELIVWRNAIVHQDFRRIPATRRKPHLKDAVAWRRACEGLVIAFDETMRQYLQRLFGVSPW